jgi:hypothetical protein
MGFEIVLDMMKSEGSVFSRKSWEDGSIAYNNITNEIEYDYMKDFQMHTTKWTPKHEDIVANDWEEI